MSHQHEKPDAVLLWNRLIEADCQCAAGDGITLEPCFLDASKELGMHYRRARALALKWTENGIYDYGVSWRVGRLTDAGRAIGLVTSSSVGQDRGPRP